MMIERIIDLNGNVIERPYTTEEIAEVNKNIADAETFKAEQDSKAAAKESALTKLQALGLTEEEIKALIGGI